MGDLSRCYSFCLLIVAVGAGLSYYEDDLTYDDSTCRVIILRSTTSTVDKRHIYDAQGQSVNIIKVKLIQQYSHIRCQLDHTYFILNSAVIVKKGCSGKFKVCFDTGYDDGDLDPYVLPVPLGCKIVRLLSRLNRDVWKILDFKVSSIRVARQFQEGVTCARNVNYGFKGRKVFANGGCRADFEVCFHNKGGGYGHYPDDDHHQDNCQIIILESWGPGETDSKIVSGNAWWGGNIIVKLIKQKSDLPCILGKNFYARKGKVYATNGCQGKFRVCIN